MGTLDRLLLPRAVQSSLESSTLPSLKEFYSEEETEKGKVLIRPLKSSDVVDVANLLVQTFSETLGYSGAFKWLLRKEVTWYLEDCLRLGPDGVVLVALLESSDDGSNVPADSRYTRPMFQTFSLTREDLTEEPVIDRGNSLPSEQKTVSSVFLDFRSEIDNNQLRSTIGDRESMSRAKEPSAQDLETVEGTTEDENNIGATVDVPDSTAKKTRQQLLGTLELSLNDKGRSFYFLLNPPSDAAYLANMAVHPDFRRQGHASRLLRAAESIVQQSQTREVYLHLLVEDTGASFLYKKFGYNVEKTSPGLVRLLGQDQKHLMRKCVD